MNWEAMVVILCEAFEIPPLTKRKGLKQIHANFDQLYGRLDAAYNMYTEKGPEFEMILGGIVGIYAKMCADSLLRDKLFEKGVLSKLVPLLDSGKCRLVALRSLRTMTRHGSLRIKTEIARRTPSLLRLMHDNIDDNSLQELSIGVLYHSVSVVVHDETKPPTADILRDIDIPQMFRVVLEVLKRPGCSSDFAGSAMALLQNTTYNCHEEFERNTSAARYLIAFLRSDILTVRCVALSSLLRIHTLLNEQDRTQFDSAKAQAAMTSGHWPPHVGDAFKKYGYMKCDTFVMFQTAADFQVAMFDVARSRDFYALGKTLVELVLRTEFSISHGRYDTKEFLGLPFTDWADVVPFAAQGIREKGTQNETFWADMLDLKYLVMNERAVQAVARALAAIDKYPDVAYFYYIVSLTAERELGLRYAKKGLCCKTTMTPFVKHALLFRAVEHAGELALAAFHESQKDVRRREEGVAFLMSALDDARAYMAEVPPDARNLRHVANWYVVLTLAIKGKGISPDLREVADVLDKIRINEDLTEFLGARLANTQLRRARIMVVTGYAAAQQEWGKVVKKYDEERDIEAHKTIDQAKATDDLAAWLDEKLHVEDDEDDNAESYPDDPYIHMPRWMKPYFTVSLYRCSFCGNPSAALKKCGRCEKTRYCDASCQKKHWKAHKTDCHTSP
ncbi:hypothetical protein PUNSTDRAFT_102560 [Punctularia strigosozonata HHB-11173 SS5]|uniref:uncharacterized protein n=1 Tax=Punctularia strigosozonata (strain HHB-11173) TaxID=741275 RepID=UPI0004416F5F|nr:uncharacterized protein PUNSTDRAFT_102560 [Punctularia strigosozonata HHB-11173 SS5]EIN09017.1 hypothetical protein PUNSTDRAFT_102560 [Punctularia strigosozonata HHB-11173 SS5]